MPTFTTPTVLEGPAGGGPLFSRYRLPRGISVLVTGSVVEQTRFPSIEECQAADRVYLGGSVYEVSDSEAAVLTAGGLGSYIT